MKNRERTIAFTERGVSIWQKVQRTLRHKKNGPATTPFQTFQLMEEMGPPPPFFFFSFSNRDGSFGNRIVSHSPFFFLSLSFPTPFPRKRELKTNMAGNSRPWEWRFSCSSFSCESGVDVEMKKKKSLHLVKLLLKRFPFPSATPLLCHASKTNVILKSRNEQSSAMCRGML